MLSSAAAYTWPRGTPMPKVEDIAELIRKLSASELAEFRKWYTEFDCNAWDRQFEADVKARKLDALDEATASFAASAHAPLPRT